MIGILTFEILLVLLGYALTWMFSGLHYLTGWYPFWLCAAGNILAYPTALLILILPLAGRVDPLPYIISFLIGYDLLPQIADLIGFLRSGDDSSDQTSKLKELLE
ncbi:hypothetical protein [Bifidobacterium sp. SO1]|uniref:hypothetical protein n=1 Tax=Bifidobacterium sp. SO1 TaxID=2809029 RepID=UPI001BDC1B09|nr:hypothetical protein [Bifidobacterium sp. SO1]MBT1161821.1 hypothetical protein [Bifidobacterium sp. SO1]